MSEQRGLSNGFLEDMGRQLSPYFEGVWPADLLVAQFMPKPPPNSAKSAKTVIGVNLAESDVKFGHFIGCSFLWSKKTLILFDSLAICLLDPNIRLFLNKFLQLYPDFKIQGSPFPIQKAESLACGIFTLGFFVTQDDHCGESMEDFYTRFDTPATLKNDTIVLNYILHFIRTCKSFNKIQNK